MATQNAEPRETSITDVLSDLSEESVGLIRQELRLVVADFAAQGRRLGASAGLFGGAAALGVGAFGSMTAALIAALGLGKAIGLWIARLRLRAAVSSLKRRLIAAP